MREKKSVTNLKHDNVLVIHLIPAFDILIVVDLFKQCIFYRVITEGLQNKENVLNKGAYLADQ